MDRPAERIYAGAVTVVAGGWLTAATALGPATSPMPVLAAGLTLLCALPWWASHRRRAKVRVDRMLESWPEIAHGRRSGRIAGHVRHGGRVGLAGPLPPGARPDHPRRDREDTGASSRAWAPSGVPSASIRRPTTWPTASSCACSTPTRTPTPSSGLARPSRRSLSRSTSARSRTPSPCRVLFLRRHGLAGGATGAGKSGWLNVLMGNLVACRDVVIWGIDLKKGMELAPWVSCIDRLATTPEEARALLADAVAILEARAALLAEHGTARVGADTGHARAGDHHR